MARRGICSSPLSSADEEEASPIENPHTGSKRKSKTKQTQRKKLKAAKMKKSAKELIRDASHDFVEYLSAQLSVVQQAKLQGEFGGGQGYIVKLPTSSWKTRHKREELQTWVSALGFAPLSRNALRVASLKADVILSELKLRSPSIAEDDKVDVETEVPSSGDKEKNGDYWTDPAMIRMKKYFQKLETQKLEVVSYSENHRLLSSSQHMAIADAMEDVLAQPSLRRNRRLARRLSKLGRISGRRLSSIALGPSSSSFLPPVEDDWMWDREMDKMSLTPAKPRISRGDTTTVKKNELGESVLCLVLRSGMVDVKNVKHVLRKVSTMWGQMTVIKINLYSTDQIYSHHPRGHYLADGAYKEVFKVFSSEKKRLEAISVMDIGAINDTGNQSVVRQEVAHSVLLSDATENGICPNFLRIYDVFLAHEKPRTDRWGSKTRRKPMDLLASTNSDKGPERQWEDSPSSEENERLFQYIRMEFCDGGDLEDFIGLQKNKTLPLESVVVPFFFQMVFSLYCGREKFNMRHCDVKLLNFFLKDIGRSNISKDPGAGTVLHYFLEDTCFVLRMPSSFSYWVKLADYGAADSNPENLGKPVTMDQFTTLENSPIEFLLEGDAAEQSYAADTFSLAICLLHLFTGSAPYEEILEDVRCPSELLKDLKLRIHERTQDSL
ncbi:Serine/threonine protein kinase [Phytophthora megakarya]|uniref:Serine/threonine protein kinase n=1 Tax=Phytophthora megakarya TaxID=4795 RepID=A0A225WVW8_9STRA|nr:Serine/threonine protein kinase [Phytophthora megakarya]